MAGDNEVSSRCNKPIIGNNFDKARRLPNTLKKLLGIISYLILNAKKAITQ